MGGKAPRKTLVVRQAKSPCKVYTTNVVKGSNFLRKPIISVHRARKKASDGMKMPKAQQTSTDGAPTSEEVVASAENKADKK
ncbi:unnamed protein product [Rhizoctonia solani]|uniref:Uncharacterized protein n=1 Tax=Rhizoctonia solani TaxID=456999 RepID=A0A8H3BSR9_9AGAM|nr:unnamed protein product [Rhizoctonia solani]